MDRSWASRSPSKGLLLSFVLRVRRRAIRPVCPGRAPHTPKNRLAQVVDEKVRGETLRVLSEDGAHTPLAAHHPLPLPPKPSESQVKKEKMKEKKPAGKTPAEEPSKLSKKDREQKVGTVVGTSQFCPLRHV